MALPAIRQLASIFALSAVGLSLWCAPALSHARLVQTEPANEERLSQSPEQVRLWFDEPIEAEFTPVKVLDPQGNRVDQDDARVDPDDRRVLTANLEELPEGYGAGAYTVGWRVTSLDGHPVSGSYGFNVDGASSDDPQIAVQTEAKDAGESEERPSDRAAPESEEQQAAGSISGHTIHAVGLGLGLLVGVVLLLRRAKEKRPS